MNKKLNVAIVGCGAVAQKRHIPGFMRLGSKVQLAVCDKNIKLTEQAARQCGIIKPSVYGAIYTDVEKMLKLRNEMLTHGENGKIDVVDVCTPPQIHALIAVKALEAGCHVLMEKPMALTVVDCDRMIDAARMNNRKLCVVHNVLFHPPLVRAKELVKNGKIGTVTGMRIFLSDPKDEMVMRKDYWIHKLPGGLIGETGPHPIYISLAFLKELKNVDVHAYNILEHPWARFDEFRIELETENGNSEIMVSYSGERYNAQVEIFGADGHISVNLHNMSLVVHRPFKFNYFGILKDTVNMTWQLKVDVLRNAYKVATRHFLYGHDKVIELFVDSILNDSDLPVTPEEGRATVEAMEMLVARLEEKYPR